MRKIIILVIGVLVVGAGIYFFVSKKAKLPAGEQGTENQLAQEISVKLIAEAFVSPIAFVSAKDDTNRMFLVDQIGQIKIINSEGKVLENDFLDLRSKLATLTLNYDERGLLGLAFHPNFKENGRFFVYYSAPLRNGAPSGWNHTGIVSEFMVDKNNPDKADLNSEKIIIQIDEPQFNHNGGHIVFGPDSYLYIPLGDGGQANDVGLGHSATGNGQDVSTLLGKILRIDVDNGNPYSVPQDNPFVQKDGLDEIFAYGFRNPYHISFDAEGNNELFVADVGQNLWEEVDIVTKGNNYGWNIREGKHCFDPENADQSPADCPTIGAKGEALLDPIIEYGHPDNGGTGVSIIGGYVYRGEAIEGLKGNYVFGDFSRGFTKGDGSVFAAVLKDGTWSFRELRISNTSGNRLGLFIKGIGQDANNELYLLATEAVGPSSRTGKVFKIVPQGEPAIKNTTESAPKVYNYEIVNFAFSPTEIKIKKGDTVIWKNMDSMGHTVTSDSGNELDSPLLSKDQIYSHVFENVGTFEYHCRPHPFMKGKVIVE